MWDDLIEHLADFESAVLTGTDAEGYPFSLRCHAEPDRDERVLRIHLPPDIPVRIGPASLLCHKHDENLWNLKSFLVRGTLSRSEGSWVFVIRQFIPGAGIGGAAGMYRMVVGARRAARRYLEVRGLSRPTIPWADINAVKREARAQSQRKK